MSRTRIAVFLLFFLTATTAAYAAPDASAEASSQLRVADWLAKSAQAVRSSDYQGVMVNLRGEELDTLRIVHRFHDDAEQERLVSMTGRPREIIRNGSRVITILPQDRVVLITHQQKRGNLLSRVGQFVSKRMQAHYQIALAGAQRLADRPTQVISITPRDDYRYGYRILIDTKTYLPLKLSLVYDEQVLQQIMFTEISYPDQIPDAAFKPTYDVDDFRVIDHKPVPLGGAPIMQVKWHTKQLPPGYELVETGLRTTSGGQPVQQVLFSDGVATVSAFISHAGVPNPLIGGTTMGAVHAYGRKAGAYHITVVGEVPAVTVRMIAENLVAGESAAASNSGD